MAKVIKVQGDTSKIEGNLDAAPVGLYFAKVAQIDQKKSKNEEEMVEIVWQITKDANGKKVKKPFARIWSYAPLDPNASWARRLKELVEAFGLASKNPNLGLIEGKEAMIRLREGTDNDGEYRPEVSKVLKPKIAEDEEEPDEADEEEAEDDEEEDDEESATEALSGLSRTELKALIKEESLDVTVKKSMSDDDLREAIVAAGWEPESEEDDEEEDDEEEDDDEEEADEDNYDDMSVKELRQECKDRDLDTKGTQKVLIARLRADDEEEPV